MGLPLQFERNSHIALCLIKLTVHSENKLFIIFGENWVVFDLRTIPSRNYQKYIRNIDVHLCHAHAQCMTIIRDYRYAKSPIPNRKTNSNFILASLWLLPVKGFFDGIKDNFIKPA